ncbi:M23 family metallopeptidase [Allosphingosinicella flava]|uniref:M23 family metallopeptidase n=1 Tax=Allosphingosinicella flava TaxID=2771430 RepID=A0A7T2GLS1_9SPHN|nr:M23 family metallopeptidase [Sphingosinicella flava]
MVGAGTSLFWIGAYGNGARTLEPAGAVVEKDKPAVAVAEGLIVGPAGLAIPVAGVKPEQLIDTFTQARAGGSRIHDAIDIMAPRGTPVLAAAPGTVEKLFFSEGGGGVTAYVRSPDKLWTYYYAHLDRYAPGLEEGKAVQRGTPIGTVGSTGNASPEGPHLHFAINRMQPGESWHEGSPINPYPLLAGRNAFR